MISGGGKDPHYAMVMCTIFESTIGQKSPGFDSCPRQTLANVLNRALDDYGLSFLVDFEVEFNIVRISPEGDVIPQSAHIGACAASWLRKSGFQYVEV